MKPWEIGAFALCMLLSGAASCIGLLNLTGHLK